MGIEGVVISRILHAGYTFESGNAQIAFDPIFENPFSHNCFAFPTVTFNAEKIRNLHFDAVFISHFHDDHLSLDSLDLLDRQSPIYIFCIHVEIFDWLRQMGFTNVHSLVLNECTVIGPFEVTAWRALDADVDCLFQVSAEGLNILNVVDSWIDDHTLKALVKLNPWDLVLWPFQTMRELEVLSPGRANAAPAVLPSEWICQLKLLKTRFLVPSSCQFVHESWSWYNKSMFPISYHLFTAEIGRINPTIEVIRMNPGIRMALNKTGMKTLGILDWLTPSGNQDADYMYDPNARIPSTAEIAGHFELLDVKKFLIVQNFCRKGIIKKYQTLAIDEDSYFSQKRYWRLRIFDQKGEAMELFYQLNGRCITLVNAADVEFLSWTTDLPATKLYSALEDGESLTSMYVRINEDFFDAKTESELADVDLLEDPLVRCLFNGQFGSYQAAQLKRLLSR